MSEPKPNTDESAGAAAASSLILRPTTGCPCFAPLDDTGAHLLFRFVASRLRTPIARDWISLALATHLAHVRIGRRYRPERDPASAVDDA